MERRSPLRRRPRSEYCRRVAFMALPRRSTRAELDAIKAEARRLREELEELRATVRRQSHELKIQFERIAQMQAILDEERLASLGLSPSRKQKG